MQVNLELIEKEGVLEALADCFDNESAAGQLLSKAGLKKSFFPPFGNPDLVGWWHQVCKKIELGIGEEDSLNELIKQAANFYPGNMTFRKFKDSQQSLCGEATFFLSYSRSDQQAVDELFLALKQENPNIEVFQDHRSISLGKDWLDVIRSSAGSSSLMICWVTENYLSSTFCHYEIGIAESVGASVISIIPNEDIVSKMPAYLSRLQALTLSCPIDYTSVARGLLRIIS